MSATPQKPPPSCSPRRCSFSKGVGPQRAELLARLGVRTARDLLFFFPRDYQDLTDRRAIAQLEEGVLVRRAAARSKRSSSAARPRAERSWACSCAAPTVRSGPCGSISRSWARVSPRAASAARRQGQAARRPVGDGPSATSVARRRRDRSRQASCLPVYPLTEGLHQGQMRRIVARRGRNVAATCWKKCFPKSFSPQHDLWPLRQALVQIHLPDDRASAGAGPAAVRVSGTVRPAAGAGRQAPAAARSAAGAAAGGRRPRSTPASAGCFRSS